MSKPEKNTPINEDILEAAIKFSILEKEVSHFKNEELGKLFSIKHDSRVSALKTVCQKIASGEFNSIEDIKKDTNSLSDKIINSIPSYVAILEIVIDKLNPVNELSKEELNNELNEFRTTAKELVKYTNRIRARITFFRFWILAAILGFGVWKCTKYIVTEKTATSIDEDKVEKIESGEGATPNTLGLNVQDILKYKDAGRSNCYQIEKDIKKSFQSVKEELNKSQLVSINLDKQKQNLFVQLEKMNNEKCAENPSTNSILGDAFFYLFLLNDALGLDTDLSLIHI